MAKSNTYGLLKHFTSYFQDLAGILRTRGLHFVVQLEGFSGLSSEG